MASNPSEIDNEGAEELLQDFQTFDLEEEENKVNDDDDEELELEKEDFQNFDFEDLHESFKCELPKYRFDLEKEIEDEKQFVRLLKKKRRADPIEGAPEPKVHVYMKLLRNTVPVPSHWSEQKEYLQGGIEKPPYQLPDFISETKLEEMKRGYRNENMEPFNTDIRVLHDAFFKYQTKPKLTSYGDVYYEGKEILVAGRLKKPLEQPVQHWGDLQEEEEEVDNDDGEELELGGEVV